MGFNFEAGKLISIIMLKKDFAMFRVLWIAVLMTLPMQAMADDATQSVRERIDTISADLNDNQQAHFMALTGSYNLISVVDIVREDVENAVSSCAKENPDFAGDLKARHKGWNAALDPVMADAQANVDNMIAVQGYAPSSDIKALLKFMDDERRTKNADIDKVPVTTLDACKHLRDTMDKTQEELTELLRSTLVSLPRSLQQNLREKETPQDTEAKSAE